MEPAYPFAKVLKFVKFVSLGRIACKTSKYGSVRQNLFRRQFIHLGLAHDYSPSWNPYFPDHSSQIPSEVHFQGNRNLVQERQERGWRRKPVRSTYNLSCRHYRNGQYHRSCHGRVSWRSRCCAMVLDYRTFRYSYKIRRRSSGHQIQGKDSQRHHARRPYVRSGKGSGQQVPGDTLLRVCRLGRIRHR